MYKKHATTTIQHGQTNTAIKAELLIFSCDIYWVLWPDSTFYIYHVIKHFGRPTVCLYI